MSHQQLLPGVWSSGLLGVTVVTEGSAARNAAALNALKAIAESASELYNLYTPAKR